MSYTTAELLKRMSPEEVKLYREKEYIRTRKWRALNRDKVKKYDDNYKKSGKLKKKRSVWVNNNKDKIIKYNTEYKNKDITAYKNKAKIRCQQYRDKKANVTTFFNTLAMTSVVGNVYNNTMSSQLFRYRKSIKNPIAFDMIIKVLIDNEMFMSYEYIRDNIKPFCISYTALCKHIHKLSVLGFVDIITVPYSENSKNYYNLYKWYTTKDEDSWNE